MWYLWLSDYGISWWTDVGFILYPCFRIDWRENDAAPDGRWFVPCCRFRRDTGDGNSGLVGTAVDPQSPSPIQPLLPTPVPTMFPSPVGTPLGTLLPTPLGTLLGTLLGTPFSYFLMLRIKELAQLRRKECPIFRTPLPSPVPPLFRHFSATFFRQRKTDLPAFIPKLPDGWETGWFHIKNVTPFFQFKLLYKSDSRGNPHFDSVKNCINGTYLIKKT